MQSLHWQDKRNEKPFHHLSIYWSTNLCLSNAEDHARGEPHKRALDLHLKEMKGQHERAETMKAASDSAQQLITIGITNMQSNDLARTKTTFEVAYFVAKEEMPISKYP